VPDDVAVVQSAAALYVAAEAAVHPAINATPTNTIAAKTGRIEKVLSVHSMVFILNFLPLTYTGQFTFPARKLIALIMPSTQV
jgi:hypothetical protein